MPPELRRKDRAMDRDTAWRILNDGEYGTLSTVSAEGQPYGTPLHYALMDGAIYFHCALAGHKLDNIAANDRVSLCVVGKCEVMPDEFATIYESVVVFGRATEVFKGDKQKALEALLDKYSRDFRAEGLEYAKKVNSKARVFRISVEAISGKARTA
jgi:uncharacterized protein